VEAGARGGGVPKRLTPARINVGTVPAQVDPVDENIAELRVQLVTVRSSRRGVRGADEPKVM
jgi:hypothetical protein